MENVASVAKAAVEKLKEMNMVENANEIVLKTTPSFVSEYARILFNWLSENLKQIAVKMTPFVRTSSHWLLEKAPPLNSIREIPLYISVPIGFLLILFLRRCFSGGGGNGKTMKAPGRNNVRIQRRDFESSPKSYFRNLRSRK
ncbi:hypothetical protein EJD97_000263 [Solanum chilense]|uniref:Uncharacterized protein n=1 Tax=Solanum chilense TaxID=4083 RepID=A0A6N2ANX8_SOLCI|nr:hypothetical protein EJD97_000263 [Solanum chilense]